MDVVFSSHGYVTKFWITVISLHLVTLYLGTNINMERNKVWISNFISDCSRDFSFSPVFGTLHQSPRHWIYCIYLKGHKNCFFITRRRMPRCRCRLKSRVCVKTTSVSWKSPTALQPSSRSSQSGYSTPSTWTDAHSRRLFSTGSMTTTQTDLKLFSTVHTLWSFKDHPKMFIKKLTTWTVSLTKQCQHGLICHPASASWICGITITMKVKESLQERTGGQRNRTVV